MSHPHHAASVKLIDREEFLAAVDPRRVMLLRMRTETPGVHLLGLFTDGDLRHAIIQEIGPQGVHRDLRSACEATPLGLRLAYVVPCVECAPFSLPHNIAKTSLPPSLAELKSPAGVFGDTGPALSTDKKTGFTMTSTPARTMPRPTSPPPITSTPEIPREVVPPGEPTRAEPPTKNEVTTTPGEAVRAPEKPITTPIAATHPKPESAAPKPTVEPAPSGEKEHAPLPQDAPGSTLDHIHKTAKSIEAIRALELKLHREESEFQERCAQRIKELDARELNLARREQELKARTAELNNLLSRIDGLRRTSFPSDNR